MTKIEVICRRCGKKSPADEFKIDHVYQLAVCRTCYSEREKNLPKKSRQEPTLRSLTEQKLKQEPEPPSTGYEIRKSKIFDEDDEYLEKAVQKKQEEKKRQQQNRIRTKKISENKVLYPCQECNYEFKYNTETRRPVVCPYCEKKVDHNITF